MKLGAVLVNYNDGKRVIALVDQLLQYQLLDHVAVIDNFSTDGSGAEIEEYYRHVSAHPEVQVIRNQSNLGFNKATNQGLRFLVSQGCDYAFAINSDVEVKKEVMSDCVRFLETHKDIGACSVKMIEAGKEKRSTYNFPTIQSEINNDLGITKLFHLQTKTREDHEDYIVVDFLRFSFNCLSCKALAEAGYLDDGTFLYFGEAMLARRLQRVGYKEALLKKHSYLHNHIYKKGYKMNGYMATYQDSLYYFKHYSDAGAFQLHRLKVAYRLGMVIRKILRIR